MEVGPGWQQQRCREGVGEKYFCCQKMQIFINKTHLFSVPFAFPAARMSSMATGVVGLGGAAVWLTAVVVPSHELKIRFERWLMARGVMATTTMAVLMVRARPAVGWEEGERVRVVLAPRCGGGRRYGR